MNKYISILLVLLLLTAAAAGCGSPVPAEPTAAPQQTVAPEVTETPADAPTEAPTELPVEAPDPMLGKWMGVYMEMEGLKVPMGREQGMAIDFLLEAEGKITYLLYLEGDDDLEVAADWTGDEAEFEIHSEDENMPGTYRCSIQDGVLTVYDLLGEGTLFKMARSGSPEEAALRAEAQLFQDIMDQMEAEETTAP